MRPVRVLYLQSWLQTACTHWLLFFAGHVFFCLSQTLASTSYWKPLKRCWPSSARFLSFAANVSMSLRSPTRMPFLYALEAYAGPMPRFVVPIFLPASSSSLNPSISCMDLRMLVESFCPHAILRQRPIPPATAMHRGSSLSSCCAQHGSHSACTPRNQLACRHQLCLLASCLQRSAVTAAHGQPALWRSKSR